MSRDYEVLRSKPSFRLFCIPSYGLRRPEGNFSVVPNMSVIPLRRQRNTILRHVDISLRFFPVSNDLFRWCGSAGTRNEDIVIGINAWEYC